MKSFFWILKSTAESLFSLKNMISASYVLPIADEKTARDLIGSVLFIVLRGSNGDLLFKKIKIQRVEKICFDEKFSEDGYLVTPDLLESFGITRKYANHDFFNTIQKTTHLPLGISPVNTEQYSEVLDVIRKNCSIRINKRPPEKDLVIPKPKVVRCSNAFVSMLRKELAKKYTIDEMWGSKSYSDVFVYFSLIYLRHWGIQNIDDFLPFLHKFQRELYTQKQSDTSGTCPDVDVNFEPVNPDHILTRKFVQRETSRSDLQDSLAKTENAEKRHQDILRGICQYLLQSGRVPLQSTSIDLAIQSQNGYLLFEIKTTNTQNIIAQTGKGIFQLAMYSETALDAGLDVAGKILILESITDPECNCFITKSALSLGIKILFFDKEKNWPERLSDVNGTPFAFPQYNNETKVGCVGE